jgi:predicted outer membrane repeat protein
MVPIQSMTPIFVVLLVVLYFSRKETAVAAATLFEGITTANKEHNNNVRILQIIPRPSCVGVSTEEMLINAINSVTTCNSIRFIPVNINLCDDIKLTDSSASSITSTRVFDESRDSKGNAIGLSKFDISCKNFALTCGKPGGNLARCIIDGRNIGISRIFYGINSKFSSQRVIFMNSGGTIVPTTNPLSTTNTAVPYGGALYFEKSIVTLRDTTFSNNVVSHSGGAIYVRDSDLVIMSNATGSVTASSSFIKNYATKYGGAISIDTISKFTAQVGTIRFTSNSANFAGGAISIYDVITNSTTSANEPTSTIRTVGCCNLAGITFQNNSALIGGAIYGLNLTNPIINILRNCTFRNNNVQVSNPSIYFINPALYVDYIVDTILPSNIFEPNLL